jgi:pSer/pThr/pTyr-binding forkhead associated (FHA) protein
MKQPLPIIVQLVHIHGPLKGEIQEFDRNEIHIGRHPSCDLQFPKDLSVISRKHAVVVREGNRFKIVDTSTNGTFVNGSRISETWLKSGDVIFFTQGGPKVSFLTRKGEAAPASDDSFQPPRSHEHTRSVQREMEPPPFSTPLAPSPPADPVQGPLQEETIQVPLVIQYGPALKSFTELPIVIGTQVDCDLVLDHPSLSQRHAQIFFKQGGYMVKDLTGVGKILVNNRQVTSSSPLNPGDLLFLTESGPAFQFMEGGRMAEINVSTPAYSPLDEDNIIREPDPLQKKTGGLFKKLFKRAT